MKRVILLESQIDKLFEYYSQQRLPFKNSYGTSIDVENGVKNVRDYYLDWIEDFGKVGELPKSSISLSDGINLGFPTAFEWFSSKYGIKGQSINSVDVVATKKKFYEKLGKKGFFKYDIDTNTYSTNCIFNSDGNMYVERVISISGIINSSEGGDSMYHKLVKDFQGNVGGCWSWDKGSAASYCGDGSGSNLLLRGWIRLDDIDWVETVYINSYEMQDEREIRVKPNAKVELFDILGTYDSNSDFFYSRSEDKFYAYNDKSTGLKVHRFNLGGRHIIVNATYFGNNGKYSNDGYASIYDSSSSESKYMDRNGKILSVYDVINDKLSKVTDDVSLRELFTNCIQFGDTSLYVISVVNDGKSKKSLYFIYDINNKVILHNQFYDFCNIVKNLYIKVKLDGKYNIVMKNGEYYFDEWFDEFYLWDGCCVVEKGNKYGIYNKGKNLELIYDDINKDVTISGDSTEFKDCFVEVEINGEYNLLDLYNNRLVSPIWFYAHNYIICKYNGVTVLKFWDLNIGMDVYVDVLSGKIIHKEEHGE